MKKLEFSPEQSRWLGVDEGEPLRRLATGSKTVLLERVQAAGSEALPWDRDLVLTADVRSFALADLLHLLHASNKSGFLFFEHGEHAKAVYLHRGEVVFASSNQNFDRLGECLQRAGAISPEQFEQARSLYQPSSQFGKILVERGYLSPRELWNGVKVQVEEIVRSLFSYGAGIVHFWEGEISPDNVVRLSLPTRRLIAEGLRHRDDLLKFVAWLEAPRVRVLAGPNEVADLAGTERALLEGIRAGGAFQEYCAAAGVEPLCAARTIQHLRLVSAVRVVRIPEAELGDFARRPRSDDDAVRECVHAHVKLLAEFAAPIVAFEGGTGVQERLQRVAADASHRYPELLADLQVGTGAALDPEDLIARALRYPGDRESEVRLALGELVSYLEFELVNHPKIECDDFLGELDALRAAI